MDTPELSPRDLGKPFFSRFRTVLRRTVFFGSVVIVNLVASLWLTDLFWRMGFQKAHYPLLAIFILLNGLLTLGSFHAIFGAFDMLMGRKRSVRITQLARGKTGPLQKRHAVVMPVYNEDSVKTCARIEAIYRSIEATGHLESFDFFILSDTRDLDLWVMEETSWTNLCRRLGGFGRIYYRRRKTNENRKAGNIGDFVRTWGGGYESMLVLDADSLMDGADIVTMTRVMEDYPRLGILQTPPKLIRGSSVFTRLQQFAMRLYGPLFIRGLNFWQLAGGSYWGHNALIRLKPFSEFCELPALPGREPFGGRILSHDFVEAALMVAEGWEVWLAWDIEGTYEEAPPTLVDHLIRDRRWMQGNLQHLWLIFARKLPFPTRMHLFMGIMAYLGSPLWFLFLILGTWIAYDRYDSELSQLPFETYVDRWFGINGVEQSIILTGAIFALLFLPKILGCSGSHPFHIAPTLVWWVFPDRDRFFDGNLHFHAARPLHHGHPHPDGPEHRARPRGRLGKSEPRNRWHVVGRCDPVSCVSHLPRHRLDGVGIQDQLHFRRLDGSHSSRIGPFRPCVGVHEPGPLWPRAETP
jgi:membrane glycosyltransferase